MEKRLKFLKKCMIPRIMERTIKKKKESWNAPKILFHFLVVLGEDYVSFFLGSLLESLASISGNKRLLHILLFLWAESI